MFLISIDVTEFEKLKLKSTVKAVAPLNILDIFVTLVRSHINVFPPLLKLVAPENIFRISVTFDVSQLFKSTLKDVRLLNALLMLVMEDVFQLAISITVLLVAFVPPGRVVVSPK